MISAFSIAVMLSASAVDGADVPGLSSNATAQQRRLGRILVGRSERVRTATLQQLAASNDRSRVTASIVIEAARCFLDELESDDELPSSLPVWWAMIAEFPWPDAADFLATAADHEHRLCSQIAIDELGQQRRQDGVDAIKAQISRAEFRTHYGYRFSLIRALVRIGNRDCVAALRELQTQLDGQLRHEIAAQLVTLDASDSEAQSINATTEVSNEAEPVAFEDLWLPNAEKPANANSVKGPLLSVGDESSAIDDRTASESKSQAMSTDSSPRLVETVDYRSESNAQRPRLASPKQYYGIDLTAMRMLFVIDRSGSMGKGSGSATKLESAKAELIQAIISLDSNAEFSILIYDTVITPWRSDLQPATEMNKREAVTFVQRLTPGSRTNTHGACLAAFDYDSSLETVFVLTDGQPTEGKLKQPAAIVADVAAKNRYRHLRFHTIGIGVSGPTKMFLRELASSTAGEFRDVE
ncbi:MAG: VWA domain-containing protein [Planctomycetota bacterium]